MLKVVHVIYTPLIKIEEIRGTVLLADRNTLGVRYGIDPRNLDCPLDDLLGFDMTR